MLQDIDEFCSTGVNVQQYTSDESQPYSTPKGMRACPILNCNSGTIIRGVYPVFLKDDLKAVGLSKATAKTGTFTFEERSKSLKVWFNDLLSSILLH